MLSRLIWLLFFLSGVSGLIYEVLWGKYLSLVLGNTASAHTIVLATFLGGLALGYRFLGARADKCESPIYFYGCLELSIGLFGAATPKLFFLLTDAYVHLAKSQGADSFLPLSFRIILSVSIVLIPAVLMGGTLPALIRFAAFSPKPVGTAVSWLYFLNSAGAALGASLAGFVLIPTYGLGASIAVAAGLNIAIGITCLVLGKRQPNLRQTPSGNETPQKASVAFSSLQTGMVYAGMFLSGAAVLTYEIGWIRLLSLVLGSSGYSFALMLAAFIAGIALGSLLITSWIQPETDCYLLFGLAEVGIALTILLAMPFYERLPYFFFLMSDVINPTPMTFYIFQALKFMFCFLLMLLPTALIGMTLPLASQVVAPSRLRLGEKVGGVFSVNAMGNVVGAVLGGIFLLPLMGIKSMMEAGVFVNLAVGSVVIWTASSWDRKWRAAIPAVASLAFLSQVILMPDWDKRILSSGEFRRGKSKVPSWLSYAAYKERFKSEEILFHKDGSNATVTVMKFRSRYLALKVNGKTEATSGRDMPMQMLLAHIPLLLHRNPEQVFQVGWGSGVTAGSALRHPIKRLDVVEISPAVVETADYFRHLSGDAINDQRLHLHINDAKTWLRLTPRRYDVIASGPSNPWIAGVGNLFSVEFYREARSHLKEEGIMAQWFHIYEMTDETLQLVLRTFASVFEHVTLWEPLPGDILLVGSRLRHDPDFARLAEKVGRKPVKEDLERIRIGGVALLLGLQVASDATIRKMAGDGPLNRDFFPILEYEAPKAVFLDLNSRLILKHDERKQPANKRNLYLDRYLSTTSLSSEEWARLIQFQRLIRRQHSKSKRTRTR